MSERSSRPGAGSSNALGRQFVDWTEVEHPQYGTVETDGQGNFSIPVEGGATLIVDYQKDGLIPSQRKVDVPWNGPAVWSISDRGGA